MSTPAVPSYRSRPGYHAGLLGGFAALAAALLVMGQLATQDAIEQRGAEDLRASLAQVIPNAIHDNDLLTQPLELAVTDGNSVLVYRALQGLTVTGLAFRVTGQGYAGDIDLILGIDAEGKVLGVRVLSHAETPGLGDKIEASRDDWILGFNGRSLGDPPIERWKVKKDGGEFDQFTGATITPRAVVIAIRSGLAFFAANRDALLATATLTDMSTVEN